MFIRVHPWQLLLLALLLPLLSCSSARPDANTVVVLVEFSPDNLDPRIGTNAQSERIGELIFDSLVRRDEHFNLAPWLAEKWEIPDPLTYIFHLRRGVKFHNGQALTARDVKWSLDSMLNGSLVTSRAGAYQFVASVEAPDDSTVVIHLKQPFAALLWNLSDGAFGVIPYGSGKNFGEQPVGSGPFRFVSNMQDKEVVIARNDDYWAEKPRVSRVRFAVVPDTTTRALELRKGSADIAINALTADMVEAMRRDPGLVVEQTPGTIFTYLALNTRDPILKDVRVRQALAYAIDVEPVIRYLWRGEARPARSVLPPQSWAFAGDVPQYSHDPQKAEALLEAAGYPAKNGVRLRLTMKTSTDETTRLLAAILQEQLAQVGVALDIRSYEFATFYADVVKGAYQLHSLRWIGANQDPDIFEYVFDAASFAPRRANRTFYSNPEVDRLIAHGRAEVDQQKRKQIYEELQHILAHDLPYINLWYFDNVLVHSRRVSHLEMNPSGNYDFLRTAELAPGN